MWKTVIWKDPSKVIIPDESKREEFNQKHADWKADFESNHKPSVSKIPRKMSYDGYADYDVFSDEVSDWSAVKMYEYDDGYFLYVEVS